MSTKQKIILIQKGFQLLKSQKGYSQSKVVMKLERLGCSTTNPTFNKIIKNNELGENTVIMVFEGMCQLMEKEMCLTCNGKNIWNELENCAPEIISIEPINENRKGLVIHSEGRLEIAQKVAFFSNAKKEVIEFGITLNTFSSYLLSRKPKEFKKPLLELLEKGIDFKCYLLDPDWNGTSMYFDDRASTLDEGINGIEKIRAALRKLKVFSQEVEAMNLEGTFEVFKYRHFPNNYFLIIDKGVKSHAKQMVSNYLFGQQRAYCPVMEFSRADQPTLFIRYAESFDKITKQAKKINFEEIPD